MLNAESLPTDTLPPQYALVLQENIFVADDSYRAFVGKPKIFYSGDFIQVLNDSFALINPKQLDYFKQLENYIQRNKGISLAEKAIANYEESMHSQDSLFSEWIGYHQSFQTEVGLFMDKTNRFVDGYSANYAEIGKKIDSIEKNIFDFNKKYEKQGRKLKRRKSAGKTMLMIITGAAAGILIAKKI